MILALVTASIGAPVQTPPPPSVHGYLYFDTSSVVPRRFFETSTIEHLGPRIPPDSFVFVQGQTDTVGSPGDNHALSRRRALAVADLLVLEGVNPARIFIRACGERVLNKPTADETPEPLNRFALFDWSIQPPQATALCPLEPYRQ